MTPVVCYGWHLLTCKLLHLVVISMLDLIELHAVCGQF